MILDSNAGAVKPEIGCQTCMPARQLGPGMPLPRPTPNDHFDPPCLAALLQQQCSYTEDVLSNTVLV